MTIKIVILQNDFWVKKSNTAFTIAEAKRPDHYY